MSLPPRGLCELLGVLGAVLRDSRTGRPFVAQAQIDPLNNVVVAETQNVVAKLEGLRVGPQPRPTRTALPT